MKKTFKIGEYAIGGIISAEVHTNGLITIKAKDWNTKDLVSSMTAGHRAPLMEVLQDWTSSYYAEKIMDWIDAKVDFSGREMQ